MTWFLLQDASEASGGVSPGGGRARALYGALVAVEGVGAEEQLPPAPRRQGGRHDACVWGSLLLS